MLALFFENLEDSLAGALSRADQEKPNGLVEREEAAAASTTPGITMGRQWCVGKGDRAGGVCV